MAYVFPASPTAGQRYPVNPGTTGSAQYEWNSVAGVWNVVPNFVSRGIQTSYNDYVWPTTDGPVGYQLTTDSAGNLTWAVNGTSQLTLIDDISSSFDGATVAFAIKVGGVAYTPTPPTNMIVFLGGVPQIYTAAYTITGSVITFTAAPILGTTFYSFSSEVV